MDRQTNIKLRGVFRPTEPACHSLPRKDLIIYYLGARRQCFSCTSSAELGGGCRPATAIPDIISVLLVGEVMVNLVPASGRHPTRESR